MFIQIDGNSLTYDQIHQVIHEGYSVKISSDALENIKKSRNIVEESIINNKVIYGVNTGFGKFSDTVISKDDLADLQINLIRSHACALGEPFSLEVSKVMLLLRANALAKGFSGIRLETLQLLIDCLNHNIAPVIPSQGSLGASGDLAPLSHLALLLVGEGEAIYNGEKMSGGEALKQAGLEPIKLQAKEGLALINGTQAMTAVGVVAYMEAQELADLADGIAALTLEGLQGIVDAFTPESHSVRPYPEQQKVAGRILSYLEGSQLTTTQGQIRVQDAYSLRCIPQVHGAVQQVLNYVKEKLTIEINSATDNPLIFSDSGKVISGGNFHGQPIAFAMDFLGIAMSEIASISERRIERLVNPQLNDLPAFLSPDPGLQSGLMITQYAAASLVSENKTLAHPSSVDSIPSSANQEDHVSMGTTAARHAYQIIQNSRKVLAIEAICAAQAADFRGSNKLAPETKRVYSKIREAVPTITQDRIFSLDIERLAKLLKEDVREVNYQLMH
ncbi:histidine ammonia-lyase [Peribacillus butanolivorans]|uniref:histidine ammonia-lyase n=1 Tax=Peribacillus butanolivorans TaxID=421767 RepID=UPI0006A704CE|nr:histidine ammonia-lyase [Peribacillus butanolivorans]KQU21981.1 histidine ammonia-lyase [Bacillus sp. Leaf13]KRF64652.1 histidine ammonia-lyase [Bacillus sp. Soil768D1]KON66640.1 histidine ammonia-lyase [Peribacillus butanolivorans]MCO0598895.1 histidine ammonia-lyase [Peribacillus butanolivorans]MED3689971.1 histidine ammonia-lyase [Peribacillus butanolivorans]